MSNNPKKKQNSSLPLLAFLAMCGGLYLIFGRSSEVPDVIEVSHPQDRDPQLVQMIDEQLEVVRQNPKDPRQRALLGMIFEANKMWPQARRSYMNATQLQPNEPTWAHHAGIVWLQTDDIAGAADWIRRYAGKFPRFTPLQYRLGVVLLESGDLVGADAAFLTVVQNMPNAAQGYVGRGDAALRGHRPEEAVGFLEQAVAVNPTYKTARYLLGLAYRDLGRMEDAQAEMAQGVGATPQHIMDQWTQEEPKYTIGTSRLKDQAAAFIQQGRPEQAVEILLRVLQKEPDDVDAILNLGLAYLNQNRLDEAIDRFSRVRQLDDSRFETFINLAACYRRMGQLDKALEHADLAVERAADIAQPHHTRSIVLMGMQRNEEALAALLRAESLDAQAPTIQQGLANVLVRLRRFDEAISHYEKLARILPTRWEPYLGQARSHLSMRRLDQAQSAVDAGLRLAPDEPQLRSLAAKIAEHRNP